MQLQQQEQQRYQQQEQQNQQMQQQLDQNYRQYAPQPGAGGQARGGPPPIDWWSKPALAPARNPLLGRWKQIASKGASSQQLGALGGLPGADIAASLFNATIAGGCKSIFGTGVVAFEPDSLQWVAPDGHEEILNHLAYRANGSEVVVITRDPGAIPALIFDFSNHDHAVVAFFNCTMERISAKPPAPSAMAAPPRKTPAPSAPAPAPAPAATNSVLKFEVGIATPGNFAPLANIQIWVTPENPEDALARAGFGTVGRGSLGEKFSADCRNPSNCVRDLKTMTAKALGSVRTDTSGHAQTPPIAAGRYYLIGVSSYQGKPLLWANPVNLHPGANTVTLDQTTSLLR
jgi:hypothetical protein